MKIKKLSLSTQIKKEIGHRILFFSIAFMVIIFCLTIYDLSISIKQLRLRINEQIRPIESFAINQAMIDNLDTVALKIASVNETNSTFKIEWISKGIPNYTTITWNFPSSWIYDYPIGNIAGIHFGFFRLRGGFLSDKTLIYDLLARLSLLIIIAFSFYSILYPLTKKIPEKLFINPINRFIELISNNSYKENIIKSLPVELEILESKILALPATEHARNKAAIELGHLSARLAHDIRSPLAAMELSISSLEKLNLQCDLTLLTSGIQIVRETANNVLERYYQNGAKLKSDVFLDDGNIDHPIILFNIIEGILSHKQHEWQNQPCHLNLITSEDVKTGWIKAAPNEVKRLLSNLLNNFYEAIHNKRLGNIDLYLSLSDDYVVLRINDNGLGIPTNKIVDVLNGSSLKHIGKGLGLSWAKKYIENLGGKLKISSTFKKGTCIQLEFPRANNISWFRNEIRLNNINTVMILDDDFSMLMFWEQKLSEFGLKPKLFSDYHTALNWLTTNKKLISTTIFIVDYNLPGNNVGLTFLEKIKNNNHRYLITSSAETVYCQEAVKKAGVWLIPKSLIRNIRLVF